MNFHVANYYHNYDIHASGHEKVTFECTSLTTVKLLFIEIQPVDEQLYLLYGVLYLRQYISKHHTEYLYAYVEV